MVELTLAINWTTNTNEKVYLGDISDLRLGSELITTETWKDTKDVLRYRARVESHEYIGPRLTLGLRYLEADNPDAAKNEAWGLSKITLLLKTPVGESTGTAVWQDDRFDKGYRPGIRKVSIREDNDVIPEDDIILKHAVVKARKQARFRHALLDIDPVCAITGEKCLHVLDAAHILEVKGRGGFGIGNGVVLRSDIHRLFDARLLKIDSEGRVTLHRAALTATSYSGLAKQLDKYVLKRIKKNLEIRNRADIT